MYRTMIFSMNFTMLSHTISVFSSLFSHILAPSKFRIFGLAETLKPSLF